MATEVILVRHGQSEGNLVRRFLGHTDLDITALGYQQAELVADALCKEDRPSAIISSDLMRAYHTAEAIAAKWGMEVIPEKGLREIYAGAWEGISYDELEARYPAGYTCFRYNLGRAHPDGGESALEMQKRGQDTLDKIVATYPDGRVVLVSHAAFICMLCAGILGLSPDEVPKLGLCENASITRIVHDKDGYRLLVYGDPSHLGEHRVKRPPLA